MVAQRKATTAARRPRRRPVAARATAAMPDGEPPPARELAHLQTMRADARAWVAEIERRIAEIEA